MVMVKEEEKDKGVLIHCIENPNIEKLVKIYKKDKFSARVIFMNGDGSQDYRHETTYLFGDIEGDFQIVKYEKRFGISKSSKMYSSQKKSVTITCVKNKIYRITHGKHKQISNVTYNNILAKFTHDEAAVVIDKLMSRFGWIRFMREKNIMHDVSFNTIISKKLFSFKKALQYVYKTTIPVAEILHNRRNNGRVKNLKYYLEWMSNIENLKSEWVDDYHIQGIFFDTVKMAKTLDRKINCSWSNKRLKTEHDNWSKEITDIVFDNDNRPLKIKQIYLDFESFTKIYLIKDTRGLAIEGREKKHCVATYASNVDSGVSGIFKFGEYTVELQAQTYNPNEILANDPSSIRAFARRVIIKQVRGFGNRNPLYEELDKLQGLVNSFNSAYLTNQDNITHNKIYDTSMTIPVSEIIELQRNVEFERWGNEPF
jgi:hypothetical protein